MIIKLEMNIPEADNSWVQSKAQEERLQNLKDLVDSYGYGNTASIHAEGIWLDPGAIEGPICSFPAEQKNQEIQLAVGGLALELMALEKYWNRKTAFRAIEKEAQAPDTTLWERMCP